MIRMGKKLLPMLALVCGLAATPALAGSNPFIGEIEIYGFDFCPVGWATLDGQLMSIQQNTALFSLLGTTYGGNGTSNFALPRAKPLYTATGAKLTQCIALQGIFPSRN